ncbi:MAG: hypothetical protein K9K66_11780 [Desulfarculaceae bacterium]|nr:hypothetical protein [Desulfarculaceae bacterium]MCF8071510.1 hypothetical protein [Desulfarculaceae bacterium]MCF8102325.1 hypothetical protein [Desulfarculaceae bacterium]MCF8114789.1 hypothetical protein [Desulfarculaceae bacterium]
MKYLTASLILLLGIWLGSPAVPAAPDKAAPQPAADAAAQANNPLASMTALNFQNYYIGRVTGTSENANQFWARFAQPVKILKTDWITRASLPVNTYPSTQGGGHESGLGDFNIFAAYLFDTGNPAISFGLGPQLTAPTATQDELGSEKWSGGFANVLFDATSRRFQYGYLLTWEASFAGNDDRSNVNTGALQPFAFLQLGDGLYLRAAPIWVYDLDSGDYSLPLGVGLGKVIKAGKTVFNLFVEPQVSVLDRGEGWPDWQVFVGLNMQFLD